MLPSRLPPDFGNENLNLAVDDENEDGIEWEKKLWMKMKMATMSKTQMNLLLNTYTSIKCGVLKSVKKGGSRKKKRLDVERRIRRSWAWHWKKRNSLFEKKKWLLKLEGMVRIQGSLAILYPTSTSINWTPIMEEHNPLSGVGNGFFVPLSPNMYRGSFCSYVP